MTRKIDLKMGREAWALLMALSLLWGGSFFFAAYAVREMLALALLSTALAYVMFFRILKLAGATNVSLVTFLIPVSAIALGVVVLDEQIEFIHIAGMAFIATGLVVIDGRLVTWLREKF